MLLEEGWAECYLRAIRVSVTEKEVGETAKWIRVTAQKEGTAVS